MIATYSPITVAIPGTCGELVQGWSTDWDEPVLVSCPITLYSRVTVQLRPYPEIRTYGDTDVYPKSHQAARLLLDRAGRPDLGAEIHFNSELRPGRGMASSTADIVGVMAGLSMALGQAILPGNLARLACQIEPSDSTMFAGLTALAYRGTARYREFGPAPPLPLLMLDTGHAVDTLSYNARLDLAQVRQLAPTTEVALQLLSQGLTTRDPETIGAAVTLSAVSYQAVNYNPFLEQVLTWAKTTGALGLVRAHSGSVVGLLYPSQPGLIDAALWLASRFAGSVQRTYLAPGGPQLLDGHQTTPQYLLEATLSL